jgi:hypothetical protein
MNEEKKIPAEFYTSRNEKGKTFAENESDARRHGHFEHSGRNRLCGKQQ